MIKILVVSALLWLLFNLFLFAWLGRERSAELIQDKIDTFRASLRRAH